VKHLVLTRVTRMDPSVPTCGILTDNDHPLCVTLELPWRDNHHNESCISEGYLLCTRREQVLLHQGYQIPATYEVLISDRTGILFHCGNTTEDTQGCILLGTAFAPLPNQVMITQSRLAFSYFMEYLSDEKEFDLEIKRVDW
jgi:hypothetical protein